MIFKVFIYLLLFMSVLGFPCRNLSLVAVSWSYFSLVCGLLIVVASLVAEGVQALVVAAYGLSNCSSQALECGFNCCGTWAYLLHGM